MSKIYTSMDEFIGKTPLLELCRLEKELSLSARLLAKVEGMNPAGSVKDRAALNMLCDAEARGVLKAGSVIIEPTSGNTGIALAAVAVPRGYRVIIVMPETMSAERRKLMLAYGAELVLTDGKKGMAGAIERAKALSEEIPDSMILGQFDNPANAEAHFKTTGPEIYEDTDGTVDIFVAGVGTGGTITGIGRYLKSRNADIKVVGVEPQGSPVLSGGAAGPHGLQGIGAGFVPSIYDGSVVDEIMTVTEEEAYSLARLLAAREGVLTGISSGAALAAAVRLAKCPENAGKTVVVLLPDGGERYLSTPLYS